jgi:hypothetical protein
MIEGLPETEINRVIWEVALAKQSPGLEALRQLEIFSHAK